MNKQTKFLEQNNICTGCGYEYERGVLQYVRHNEECPMDAPNESIDGRHHKLDSIAMESVHEIKERWFSKFVFSKMNIEEKMQLMCFPQMMGLEVMNNYHRFKTLMIEKYAKDIYPSHFGSF